MRTRDDFYECDACGRAEREPNRESFTTVLAIVEDRRGGHDLGSFMVCARPGCMATMVKRLRAGECGADD